MCALKGILFAPEGGKKDVSQIYWHRLWNSLYYRCRKETTSLFIYSGEYTMITFDQATDLIQTARNVKKGKPIYGLPHKRVVFV